VTSDEKKQNTTEAELVVKLKKLAASERDDVPLSEADIADTELLRDLAKNPVDHFAVYDNIINSKDYKKRARQERGGLGIQSSP